jgi:enterochelin esterase-like enzyme
MKRPIFAVACALALIVAPDLAQGSRPASRPGRQNRTPTYDGKDLAGKVEWGNVDSKLLNRQVRYGTYLPPGYADPENAKTRYPVVFFLHGLFEGASGWMSRGGAALFDTAIKEKKLPPLILIVPDAGMSFYSDTLDGKKPYARFFIEELVPLADQKYRTTARREERVVAGSSMGGFGALRFALKHPELFSAVIAHSPAILWETPADVSPRGQRVMSMLQDQGDLANLFGDPIDLDLWKASNPLSMAETCDLKPGVDIYVDCGESDSYGFDETCRSFDAVLTKRNIPHEFAIRPGGHGWNFMRSAFPYSVAFLDKHLKKASNSGSATASPKKAAEGAASRPGGN